MNRDANDIIRRVRKQVAEVLSYKGVYEKNDPEKRTVMEELRDNQSLPPDRKTSDCLVDECHIAAAQALSRFSPA